MKILVNVSDEDGGMYLVSRLKPVSIDGILKSVVAGDYAAAIVAALTAGGSVEEVGVNSRHSVSADLIITRGSAHWDLCSGRRRW